MKELALPIEVNQGFHLLWIGQRLHSSLLFSNTKTPLVLLGISAFTTYIEDSTLVEHTFDTDLLYLWSTSPLAAQQKYKKLMLRFSGMGKGQPLE